MLVVARLPFAATGFERHGAETIAPVVAVREAALPELFRRGERQGDIAFAAGVHVDAVPADAVGGIGKAGLEPPGIVLGLTDAGGMAQPGFLGLDDRQLAATVAEHVVRRQRGATLSAGQDAAGADQFALDLRPLHPAPTGLVQHRVDAVGAGVGFGFVHGHDCNRPL